MARSKADEVLEEIERSAHRRYLPIIGPSRGRVLIEAVRRYRPRRILEVGTLVGYSTILMGKELGEGSEIVSIEYDRDEAEQARANIARAELPLKIEVLVGDALEIIPTLEGSFDMVFMDAAKHQYLDYLRLVEDKLRSGCVVVADNVGFMSRSMRGYLDHVRDSGKYESTFHRSGLDGVEVSVKL
ncbi:O-methyltransferase [Candidatus Bathyarchaeota archaeon]|nr:O-methyltransferase [Candidatus Bathyarchaeota archaeon]